MADNNQNKNPNIVDEIINGIVAKHNEIEELKKQNKSLQANMEAIHDRFYEYMLEVYNETSYEIRCKKYVKEYCRQCFHGGGNCNIATNLPGDILKPKPNPNKNTSPIITLCGGFEWD